ASMLYIRIKISQDETFLDLLRQVTNEYCKAYEHADCSYIAAQMPRPEFTRNPAFNWVPQGSEVDRSVFGELDNKVTCSPISFAHPMLKEFQLDHEPVVVLYD